MINDAIQTDMNAGAEFRKVIASLHNLEILQICKFSRQNIYRDFWPLKLNKWLKMVPSR